MSPRCAWCNGSGGELIELTLERRGSAGGPLRALALRAHAVHQAPLLEYHRRVERWRGFLLGAIVAFILLVMLFMAAFFALNRSLGLAGIGLTVILLGGVVVALPFATPQTVARFGVRASVRLARAGGLVIIGLGAILLVLLAFTNG